MSEGCAIPWCVGVPPKGDRYCTVHQQNRNYDPREKAAPDSDDDEDDDTSDDDEWEDDDSGGDDYDGDDGDTDSK